MIINIMNLMKLTRMNSVIHEVSLYIKMKYTQKCNNYTNTNTSPVVDHIPQRKHKSFTSNIFLSVSPSL